MAEKKEAKKEKKVAKSTKVVKKAKKKSIQPVPVGNVYIQASYNNTIVTFTDPSGNVIAWSSAGQNGFKGPKKATPYAAGLVVKAAVEKLVPFGTKDVVAYVKGIGMGREGAVRALQANGLNVLNIKDVTPLPHNGCRQPRPRRV
jgi:small subunit ribosomal protein S11